MELLEKDVQDTLLVKPFNVGAHLRLSTPFVVQPNIRSCLFAISNQFGWAIIGIQSFENHQSGPAFILTQVETLTKSLQNAEPHANTWITPQDAHLTIPISSFCDPNSVVLTHLAFAASDRLVVAATSDGTLSIFSLQNLISKTNITPLRQFIAHSNIPVQALIPNPAPGGTFSAFIAVVYADSRIRVLDLYDVQKVHWEAQSITAAEWSPMGKRLIVGYKDGKLEYFTHDGQSKGVIEAPTQAEGMEVLHIKWIDQKDYIITFCEQVAKEGFEELATETFALHVKKQTVPIDSSFRSCPDPTPAQGVLDTSPNRLMTRLPTCSPATWRHLIIVALSNSTELGIIGFEDAPEPSLLILSEDHRLEIPSSEESYEPASPLGVAATFSTPTSSIIWSYTTDGVLSLWNTQLSTPEGQGNPPVWVGPPMDQEVLSRDSGINSPPADQSKSPGSNRSDRTAAPEQQTTDLGPPASTSSEFPSAQATPVSAFSQPSQGTTAFGQTAFGQQSAFGPSAFGQSAFGTQSQPASISVFGAGNATFGPPAPTGAVAPASVSLSGSQTAFGQSPFGQSAFGQSTFGTKPLSASTSAFGTGQNSFGQSTSTSVPASTPFSSGPTAFGQSGFGSSAFGQSAFGQTAFGTKSQSANTSVFGAGQATQAGSTSTLVPASTSFSSSSSTTPVGFAAFANASSTKTAQETAGASTSGSNNTGGFAQFNNGSASLQLGAGLLADSSSSTGNIFGAPTSTPSSITNNPVTPAVWGASDNSNSTLQRPSFATPIHSFSGTSTSNSSLSFAAMAAPRNNASFGQLRGSSTSPPQTQAEVTETNSTPPSPIIPSSDNVTTEDVLTSELASASTDEPAEISFSGLQFGTSTSLGSSAQTTVDTQEIADSDSDQEGSEPAPSSPIASPEQNVASDLPTPSSPDVAANSSLSALQVDHTSSLESSETLEASQTTGDETEEPEAPAGQEVAPVPHSSPSIPTASEVETTNISSGPEPTLSSEIASEAGNATATNEVPASFSSSSNEELPSTQPLTSPSSPQTTYAETGDISGVPKPTLSNAIASDEGNAATINDDENTLPTTPASSKIINKIGSPLRNELSLPSTPTPASPRSPKPTAEIPKSGASSSPGFEQLSTTGSTFSTPSKGKAGAIFGESLPTLPTGTPSDEETVGSVTNAIVDTPPASSTLPATPSSSKVFATIGSPVRNELLLPFTPTSASPRSPQATAETQKSGASASPGFGQFASSGSSSFSTPAKGVTVDDFGSPKPTSSNDVASDEGNAATADGPQNALPESSSSKVLATVGSPLRNELTLPSTPKSPSPQPPLATAVSLTPGLGTSTSQGFGQFSGSGSSFSTPSKGDTADIFGNPKPTLPTATASDEGNAATTKAVMATPPGSASSSKVPATFGSSLKNELTLPSTSKSPSPQPPQTTAVSQGFGASASRGFGQFSGSASSFSTPSKGDTADIFGNLKPTLPTSDEGNTATTRAVMATPPGSASSSKVLTTFGSSLKNELTLPSTSKSPSPQPPQTTAVTQGFGASASRGFGQFSGSASSFSTPAKGNAGNIFGASAEQNADTTKHNPNSFAGSSSFFKASNSFNSPSNNELSFSQHRGSPRSLEDSRADAVPSTSITPSPGVNPPLSDSGSEHSSVTGSEKSCIGKSTSSFPPSVANPGLKQSKNQAKDVSSVGQSGPFQSSSQVLNRTPHLDGVSSLKSQMPSLERTMTGLQAPSTPISRSISDPSVVASSTSSSSRVNQSVSMPAFQERTAGLETPQKSDLCGSISGQPQALRDNQAQCNPKMSFFSSPRSALADSKSLLDANPKLSGPVGITLPKLVSQENVGPSAGMQARTVGVPSSLCSSPVKAALPSITKATPPHDPKLPFSTQPATVSLPITSLDHALVPKIIASSEPEALPSIDVGIEQAILRVVDISSSTLQSLASVCHTCQSYIEGCNVPLRSPDSKTEQHTLKQWQMADLPTLSRHVNSLTEQAQTEITRLDSRCQIVRALESGVSKAELKHDEVKRILRAYNDPGYFRVLGSRQLSPVQLARQKSMRRSFQDIKLGTSQVSVALESLRSRLIGIKAGRRQMQPPFLDTINRSVHQLTQALSHHILYIHHLSSRVRALQAAQSKTNQSSLELVPHNDFTSSVHEQNQAFTESAALQALQSEHTGVRFRDAILGQRSRPVLTVPQESDSAEESALSLILPDQPIIIKPRKASAPLRSSLSYECRSPTWFNSPRLSNGRLSEGQPVSSPSLAPPPAPGSGKAGQWFGSEQITGSSGGWMRGSR